MVPISHHLRHDKDLQVDGFASNSFHIERVHSERLCARFLSICLHSGIKISRSPLFSMTLTMLFFFFLHII